MYTYTLRERNSNSKYAQIPTQIPIISNLAGTFHWEDYLIVYNSISFVYKKHVKMQNNVKHFKLIYVGIRIMFR